MLAAALRPDDALVGSQWHSAHSLVVEFLYPLSFKGFGRVDVALRVDRDAMHAIELAGLTTAATERRQFRHAVALDDAYALVLAVGDVHEALLGIFREGD